MTESGEWRVGIVHSPEVRTYEQDRVHHRRREDGTYKEFHYLAGGAA